MKPLDGKLVLDLTRLLPGALVTRSLASFGAEVWKVEAPGHGDYARNMPPLFAARRAVGMPTDRPMMFASASGALKTRVSPNLRCNPGGNFEPASLPFHLIETAVTAGIGDVLTQHDDIGVVLHLIGKTLIDQLCHRPFLAAGGRIKFGIKMLRCGIHIW